jgi:protein-serine/threonine kinase
MLAGYLPFDDDPANPEGDNINLLYKYIVNTPLTFPEYVTPHARDLLRRILVPNPRKRADLFEVARHSWLSEYAHVVEFITSSTTTPKDIQNTTVPPEDDDAPSIARSASVRESTRKSAVSPTIGGLANKPGTLDADAEYAKQQRDAKRRTVQVEYVAPSTTTQRGESSSQASTSRTRAPEYSSSVQPSSVPPKDSRTKDTTSNDPYGKAPASSRIPPTGPQHSQAPPATTTTTTVPVRGGREAAYLTAAGTSGTGPAPSGSSQSVASKGPTPQQYGQPAPPEVAGTNAHGSIQQPPRRDSLYGIPPSASQTQVQEFGRPSISSVPPKFARVSGFANAETPSPGSASVNEVKGHKRSSTMGEISTKLFGRSGSLFGGRNKKRGDDQAPAGEKTKKYPPISMNNSMPAEEGRPSIDSKRSRRSFSIGLGKKASGSITGSQKSQERSTRRFSFIPTSFSLKAIGIGKDDYSSQLDSQQHLPIQDPPASAGLPRKYIDQDIGREQPVDAATLDGMYEQLHTPPPHQTSNNPYSQGLSYPSNGYGNPSSSQGFMPQPLLAGSGSEASVDKVRRHAGSSSQLPQQSQQKQQQSSSPTPLSPQEASFDSSRRLSGKNGRGVLQKNKRFVDAWEAEPYRGGHDHSGSSGPARKVMDFFRRRARARAGELG